MRSFTKGVYLTASLFLIPCISVPAQTVLNVPLSYPSIQAAIDSSVNGDTILVAPGRYLENVNFRGKNIILASRFLTTGDTAFISGTVLDGNASGSVVTFKNGEDSTAVLSGFTITNGSSEEGGGGIYCFQSSPSVNYCIIRNNVTKFDGRGGGICCTGGSCPELRNLKITGNQSYWGGGISCYNQSNIRLYHSEITNNKTQTYGGGASFEGSDPVLDYVIIDNNTGTANGGGLDLNSSYGTFNHLLISNNSQSGIYNTGGDPEIFNSMIIGNSAGQGGGINSYGGSPNLTNVIIANNQASGYAGGMDIQVNSRSVLTNVTVVNNHTGWQGGGALRIYYNSRPLLINCIVSGNSSPGIIFGGGIPSVLTIAHSLIHVEESDSIDNDNGEFMWMEGNLFKDPLLQQPDSLDFSLSNSSPCIGAGIDSLLVDTTWFFAPHRDYSGNQRPDPSGSFPDMGAFENPRAIPSPSLKFDISGNPCAGDSLASINMDIRGGFSPYTITWENPAGILDTLRNLSGLPAGQYFASVTDSLDRTVRDTVIITDPEPLTFFRQATDCNCRQGNDGRIDFSAVGGTLPYEYSWSGPGGFESGSDSISGLVEGTYYIRLGDRNGCSLSDSGTIGFVNEPPLVKIDPPDTAFICPGREIILDAGEGAAYQWEWSDERSLSVSNPARYWVNVTDENGCTGSDTVEVLVSYPREDEEICLVTVGASGHNIVVWEKNTDAGTALYNIYREGLMAGQYYLIGQKWPDELSILVDETSNPYQQAYRYKLSVTDTCGNESEKSFFHKTIHLQVNPGMGSNNLVWTDYEYEAGGFTFVQYDIYRGPDPDNMEPINSIAASFNTYSDLDPPGGALYYQVAGLKPEPCHPSGNNKKEGVDYEYSLSNIRDNGLVGIQPGMSSARLTVYPQPASGELTVILPSNGGDAFELFLYDLSGKMLLTRKGNDSPKVVLSLDGIAPGLYLLEYRGRELFRTRILVE
jgi:hypothetical protein